MMFEKGNDTVLTVHDLLSRINGDHRTMVSDNEHLVKRNQMLQNMVDKLIAELANKEEKIVFLESALTYRERAACQGLDKYDTERLAMYGMSADEMSAHLDGYIKQTEVVILDELNAEEPKL